MRNWKDELLRQRRDMIEEKLRRAEQKRLLQLQMKIRKAHEEETKVRRGDEERGEEGEGAKAHEEEMKGRGGDGGRGDEGEGGKAHEDETKMRGGDGGRMKGGGRGREGEG